MLYKKKQIYWIDNNIGGKRINVSTGKKDKANAYKFLFNMITDNMVYRRLKNHIIINETKYE
jgi:hypothetical protein